MLSLTELKKLLTEAQTPLINQEKVYFVYSGETNKNVELIGDMNCWLSGYDKLYELSNSGIYYIEKILPLNSRIEYKFIVNNNYELDKKNPKTILTELGENSVLEMPEYPAHPEFKTNLNFKLSIEKDFEINSKYLNYKKKIKLLLPYNFDANEKYFLVIFNNGNNYYKYGLIKNIFDYITNKQLVKPFVIALIYSSNEEKNFEYNFNLNYSKFILEELLSLLNIEVKIIESEKGIILGGNYLGALEALFSATKSEKKINKLILQSLTTEYNNNNIYSISSIDEFSNLDIYLCWGNFEKYINNQNLISLNEKFIEFLETNKIKYYKMRYNQGHNWIMWAGDLLNAFIYHLE
ncbi:MAG TPA: alpha/beta hydrolase-fold protein [bacterium]|nr:alpha/beta hydrolase-fold protein [bacterium]HOL46779.1 alpha/beta hydrolase-fold protein [bacterium]HPQ17734.1 alpha/beta hydrolase-fold protein [bacterium]